MKSLIILMFILLPGKLLGNEFCQNCLARAKKQKLVDFEEARCHLNPRCKSDNRLVKNSRIVIKKWAEQNEPKALFMLGHWSLYGHHGVKKDPKIALDYFYKAAKKKFALAQHELGMCYEFGLGTAVDLKQAKKWYQLAHKGNDIRASISLKRVKVKELKEQ